MKRVVCVCALASGLAMATGGCIAESGAEDTGPAEEQEDTTTEADPVVSCATEVQCAGAHELTVYENSDCSGGRFFFCPGSYSDLRQYTTGLGWFANWNDRISAVYTHHVRVYAYQHVNYQGDVKYFADNQFVDIGASLWNDQISSLRVYSAP